jgi:acetate kinase
VTRCEGGDAAAQLALDVYVHRLSGAIAAMAASMGGMDALVFTGGVGERSYAVRARACSALAFLGVETVEDADATGDGRADREISSEDAGVRTFVIRAREDLEVARQVRAVM